MIQAHLDSLIWDPVGWIVTVGWLLVAVWVYLDARDEVQILPGCGQLHQYSCIYLLSPTIWATEATSVVVPTLPQRENEP